MPTLWTQVPQRGDASVYTALTLVSYFDPQGIVWQANALNMYVELLDEGLWDYSIKMRDRLNKRFNKTHGALAGHMAEYGMLLVRGLLVCGHELRVV